MNAPLPKTMRAIQQDEADGKLFLREVPVPQPKEGEVLVKIHCAPINPTDLNALRGMSYTGERTYPFIPGMEGSGVVVQAGKGMMGSYLKGKKVACAPNIPGDGCWAEYMLTSASRCVPIDKKMSFEEGAMILVNPLTALGFFEILEKENHKGMINPAAASALGGMVIQLAKEKNIPVIHIVRRAEQIDLVKEKGGIHILNSSSDSFQDELHALAASLHTDLILDPIGGDMTYTLTEVAPIGSTILLYSKLSEENSTVNPRTLLNKDLRIEGFFLSNHLAKKSIFQKLQLIKKAQKLVAGHAGQFIRERLPLEEVNRAVDLYRKEMSKGKFMLEVVSA
ncbi:MAG: zinc-binding dehydrogenase [Bacteroidota bacterium]